MLSTPTGTKARCQPGARAVPGPEQPRWAAVTCSFQGLGPSGLVPVIPEAGAGADVGRWGDPAEPQQSRELPSSLGSWETRSRWPRPLTLGSGPQPGPRGLRGNMRWAQGRAGSGGGGAGALLKGQQVGVWALIVQAGGPRPRTGAAVLRRLGQAGFAAVCGDGAWGGGRPALRGLQPRLIQAVLVD